MVISRENPKYLYKTVIPCNLYGKYDKFDPEKSHMIPSVIRKIHVNNGEIVEHRPVGGRTMAMASAEYTIPVISHVRIAGFYDVGNVWRDAYDFSFSGLKTAVLREVQRLEGQDLSVSRKLTPGEHLPSQTIADLAASFQRALVDALVEKTVRAAQETGVSEICVCGGVSANAVLRQSMRERSPVPVSVPPIYLCTDNAAMIATAGYYRFVAGERAGLEMDVIPNLRLVA